MNPEPGLLYDLKYLIDPHLTAVVDFEGRACEIPTIYSRKNEAIEQRLIFRVERQLIKTPVANFLAGRFPEMRGIEIPDHGLNCLI